MALVGIRFEVYSEGLAAHLARYVQHLNGSTELPIVRRMEITPDGNMRRFAVQVMLWEGAPHADAHALDERIQGFVDGWEVHQGGQCRSHPESAATSKLYPFPELKAGQTCINIDGEAKAQAWRISSDSATITRAVKLPLDVASALADNVGPGGIKQDTEEQQPPATPEPDDAMHG